MKRTQRTALAASSALLASVCFFAPGCAAARDPTTGEIVVGFGLARLPETGNQLLSSGLAAATGIPGIGPLALGLLTAGGLGYGVKKQAEVKAADKAWSEAQATYSPPPGTVVVATHPPPSVVASPPSPATMPTNPAPPVAAPTGV